MRISPNKNSTNLMGMNIYTRFLNFVDLQCLNMHSLIIHNIIQLDKRKQNLHFFIQNKAILAMVLDR